MGPKPRPPEDRFWEKVTRGLPGECWGWKASTHLFGYGKFYVGIGSDGRKVMVDAHRFSWELAHGRRVPRGKCVRHSCDNPPCCNPDHLLVGTLKDNSRDCSQRGRNRKKLTDLDVAAIRTRRAAGELIVPLGKEYGITHAMVSHICTRRTWKHLP